MLDKQKLEDGLRNMPQTEDPPPAANAVAADELAKVFETYYKDAMAGDTVVTLSAATLSPTLLAAMNSTKLMETLGTSLQTWSLTWAWSSAAFTGAPGSTIAVGSSLDTQMVSLLDRIANDNSNPPVDNLPELVDLIHDWSTTITVTLINNQSGSPSVAAVS